jgi:CBS domain-containing protein
MVQKVSEVMTPAPVAVQPGLPARDAARAMRDYGIGAVLVTEKNGRVTGLVTDRDIVVRAVADGRDPGSTPVSEACSKRLVTAMPGEDADVAVRRMREHGVRRIPVVDGHDVAVGMLSIGDMAIERDERSALADISAQPSNA